MPGKWGYIGGGAALLVAGFVATRSDLFSREAPLPATAAPTAAETAAIASGPAPSAAAPDDAELARLGAELTEREAENAELRTTLAVRDQVVASLKADLATRDSTIGALETRIAASDAEIASLRGELAALRLSRSFEAKRALFEPGPEDPSAARVEAVRADAPDLEAVFDAAETPAAPLMAPAAGANSVEVHFDFASARLTPGGQANTAAAAVTLAGMPLAAVRVIGHTDRVGGKAANRRLAAKRARTVAEALVAAGVPRALIDVDDRGEAEPPVATDDGVPEPLNRTVAIIPVPLPT